MKAAQDAYQKTSTLGMSQLDLILSVYKGAIGFMKTARAEFQQNRFTTGRTACEKARTFVVHLYTTLDMDKGEHIARYLGQLYAYLIQQIDQIVASKSQEQIDDVIGVLTTLKEGWEELKMQEEDTAISNRPADTAASEEGEAGELASASAVPAGSGGITISA